ncbi:MAG: hypothetical protein RPU64_00850 [Candidatus Sedimenticola sp. (ex Thyasira tokunagai)]
MKFDVDQGICKQAKLPHDLFMIGLGGQLLLGPAAIFLDIGRLGLLLPLVFSLIFFIYSYFKSQGTTHWFVIQHWNLALRRYKFLYIAYGITTVILILSWYIGTNIDPSSPQKFLPVALTRIGVMPTVVMIFVSLVLGNGGLSMANKGDLPDKMVKRNPPPDGLKTIED